MNVTHLVLGALLALLFSASDALAVDCPDEDKDGYTRQDCGGEDCDDADASIGPDAEDLPNDGIDQNCDGVDFTQNCDQDKDGYESLVCGGDDCNDLDPNVYVGAPDPTGDGLDQDCSGDGICEPTVWVQGPRTCAVAGSATLLWLPLSLWLGRLRRREQRQ